ncbi:glucoside xylosyltransferase 1-like isoform X1 [Oncorhynchus keta]|uniref:glucoside xylosyltransferase 1-like isoform X1 n=1 Tax=Oncorhynchus keta TaxID=8018 RepID=UPI00227BB2AE|nr:glucoside xylosyltransferase 1-like isoform X1 [Oncorhynchus keta]
MRCYLHALLLCMVFAVFSVLYVFNQLPVASSFESQYEDGWTDRRTKKSSGRQPQDTGHIVRNGGEVPSLFAHQEHDRTRTTNTCLKLHITHQGYDDLDETDKSRQREKPAPASIQEATRDERLHLAVVACGPRLEETLTMLKSALLFSAKPLHFHIFAEDHLHGSFGESLDLWPSVFQTRFNYTTYPITFPSENAKEWKKLFKPCASQRLFLPLILKDLDSLLYVDTDILFLQPVEEIWSLLSLFNSTHLAAMAPEHEEPRIAWYNRFARHPYYGKTGVNSGVMLMNMTRIREKYFKNDMTSVPLKWVELLMPLLQKYKLNITWGDQDLLNIIFHHNPESLYVFPCQWNYRPDHCIYGSNCLEAEQEGVFILHGNRGVYHDDKQPAFRAVYEAIQKYTFGDNLVQFLLLPLEAKLQETKHTYCGRASHMFTKRLKRSISILQQETIEGR